MKSVMQLPWFRGLVVLLCTGLLGQAGFGQTAKKRPANSKPPTVLFVCEHGAAKSVIAGAFFDKFAKQKGLKYRAVFRGTNPDPVISPITQKGLKEDGLDVGDAKPTLVSKADMDEASQIITLGCRLPDAEQVTEKVTDWSDIPSPSNYQMARDAISKRVQSLVDDLAKKTKESSKKKQTVQ